MSLQTKPTENDPSIGLTEILAVIRRRRLEIIFFCCLGLLAGFFFSRSLPEIYSAQVKIVLEPTDTLFEAVPEIPSANLNTEKIETELEIIESRYLAGRIVDKLDLVSDPFFNSYLNTEEPPAPEQSESLWNTFVEWTGLAENTDFASLSLAVERVRTWLHQIMGGGESEEIVQYGYQQQREDVISTFLAKVHVERFGQSLALLIKVAHTHPETTAEIANTIAEEYLDLEVEKRRESTATAIDFLKARSHTLASQVSETEQRIADHRLKYRLDDQQYTSTVRAEIKQLQVQAELLRNGSSGTSKTDDPAVAEIETTILQKTQELEKRNLAEIELRQMEREAQSLQQRFQQVIARLGNLDLQAEPLNQPGHVLSYAQTPTVADSPKRNIIMLIGLMLGGIAGLTYILLREGMDMRIRNESDLSQITSLPLLAMVPEISRPFWKSRFDAADYILENPFSHYADSIRELLNTCQVLVPSGEPKVLLVTSSVEDEGKTTTSLAMAVSSAREHYRTLVIDLDFHKCAFSRTIGLKPDAYSLVDYLNGDCDLSDIIFPYPDLPGLDVIGFPHFPENNDNLFDRRSLSAMMDELKKEYDTIILDSSPILTAGNTTYAASVANAALVLVRWEKTEALALRSSLKKLQRSASLPIAVAINRVNYIKQAKLRYDPAARYPAYSRYYYRK